MEEALVKATVTPEESAAVAMWEAAEVKAAVAVQEEAGVLAEVAEQEAVEALAAVEEAGAPRRLAHRAHHATVWTERNVKEKAAVRAFLFLAAVSRWEEAPTAATNVRTGCRVRIMKHRSTK